MRTTFAGRQVMPAPPQELVAEGRFDRKAVAEDSAEQQVPPLFQFLTGLDTEPRLMTLAEIEQLGDAFTQHVLIPAGNSAPLTLRELVRSIESSNSFGSPRRNMFMVDEGAKPHEIDGDFSLETRLVFTWRSPDAERPAMLVSTVAVLDDRQSLLQLIAWSEQDQAFHFFERKAFDFFDRTEGAWGWAGNSFHALAAPTRGQGPFDSHINGGLVMKELKLPWSHWHSSNSHIPRSLFPADSEFNTDPIFEKLDGADAFEGIVRAGITHWTKGRIRRHLNAGVLAELPDYLRQLLWSTSVNLVSSNKAFRDTDVDRFDLPTTFFFDSDAVEFLAGKLNPDDDVLPAARLTVDATLYRDAVAGADIHVLDQDEPPHHVRGDTNFAFLVPERALEDQAVLRELVEQQVLSPRLALCLVLVDFANPVFSPSRAALLNHVPPTATAGANGAQLDSAFVSAVQAHNGDQGDQDSPEAEFLRLWNDPDIVGLATATFGAFHSALQSSLQTANGVADIIRLAESRRRACRGRSLFEFSATLPTPAPYLAMAPDATVFEKPSDTGEAEL